MASRRIDERRAQHERYKDDVKREGHAVLPARDVPRHGDEPRRRVRDRRARRASGTSPPRAPRTRACSARTTRRRPTRARRTSSRARTGTSTSSSTCCGSSSGRTRWCSAPSASRTSCSRSCRAPVHRPAPRAPAAAAAGRDRRRDPRRARDGHADLQGRDGRGGARLGAVEAVPEWAEGQGFEDNEEAVAGARALRRAPAAPSATSTSAPAPRTSARRTSPTSARRTVAPSTSRRYVTNPAAVRQQRHAALRGRSARRTSRSSASFLDASKGPQDE